MQFNMVIMALAGSARIFELMDELSEEYDGQVTLVNAKIVNDELQECEEHTGIWAWKEPCSDGTVTYTRLQGIFVSMMWTLAMRKISRYCTTSPFMLNPAKRLLLLGLPVPENYNHKSY